MRARSWMVVAAGALAWAWGAGCEFITAPDRDLIYDSGTTTGFPEGGAGGEGCKPEQCPGESSDCHFPDCVDGACGSINAAAGSACSDGEGDAHVCDGAGTCVECADDGDCDFNPALAACSRSTCVAASCEDGKLNQGETGLDDGAGAECGGPNCNACDEGQGCNVDGDCLSFVCDESGSNGGGGGAGGGPEPICTECAAQTDCPPERWCDVTDSDGRCHVDLGEGAPCTLDEQCPSNDCATTCQPGGGGGGAGGAGGIGGAGGAGGT